MYPPRHFSPACSVIVAAAWAGMVGQAGADECGAGTPDYTATRTVTVDGRSIVLQVFMSGLRMREEQAIGGGKMIVLRLPAQHLGYAFDPASKHGVQLPEPPNIQNRTRVVDEPGPDGTHVKHLQFRSSGAWVDISTTQCSATGIALHQTFASIDLQGNPTHGEMTQTNIRIGRLPDALFRLPDNITIGQR